MQLRDHPLMSYRGIRNWPPVWTIGYAWRFKTVTGEVGTLKHVMTNPQIPKSCFLVIEHEGSSYTGCLLLNEATFCQQITRLLEFHVGRSIKEIGDLDVSHTL